MGKRIKEKKNSTASKKRRAALEPNYMCIIQRHKCSLKWS